MKAPIQIDNATEPVANAQAAPAETAPPEADAAATLTYAQREQLVEDHRGYARGLAAKVRRKAGLPRYVEQQELEGWALLGLVEAGSRFEPERGVPFGAYAQRRIIGSVLNGIGKMHQAPESARQRVRRLARLQDVLPDFEVGAVPEESASTRLARSIRAAGASILIQRMGEGPEPTCDASPADAAMDRELHGRLRDAMSTLNAQQVRVMRMYYFEDKSMAEVGQAMGISTPTVCRRHKEALVALGEKLGAG